MTELVPAKHESIGPDTVAELPIASTRSARAPPRQASWRNAGWGRGRNEATPWRVARPSVGRHKEAESSSSQTVPGRDGSVARHESRALSLEGRRGVGKEPDRCRRQSTERRDQARATHRVCTTGENDTRTSPSSHQLHVRRPFLPRLSHRNRIGSNLTPPLRRSPPVGPPAEYNSPRPARGSSPDLVNRQDFITVSVRSGTARRPFAGSRTHTFDLQQE